MVSSVEASTPKEIYRAYKDSVVLVKNEEMIDDKKIVSYGTAFSINDKGDLLTSAHLIKPNSIIQRNNVDEIKVVAIRWINKELDLAIVRVNELIKPIPLSSSNEIIIGEELTVISNPSGFQNSLAKGLLSAKRQCGKFISLQHSVPISPGSSGGPLFNENGEVVGVIQGIYAAKNSQNLNFAIPIEYIPKDYLYSNKQATKAFNQ